jgi:hypothetical protein
MPIRPSSGDAARLVACATVLATACHGPGKGRAGEATLRIETLVYTDTQLMYAAPETLTVRADGTLRYESHTNGFRPAQQDIGVYETTLPEASLRELESALSEPPLSTLPDHSGRLPVDGRERRVVVTADHRTVTKTVNTAEPVDARLERIMARLDGLAKVALGSPVSVLHGDLEQVTVDEKRGFEAVAVLSNHGPQAVQCRVPTSLVEQEGGRLAIDAWQDREPRAHPWVRSPVSAVEELSRAGGATVEGYVLDLPPRAAISYRIHARLAEADDGPSSVQLVYNSLETPLDGVPVLTGELRATAKTTIPKAASAVETRQPR